MSARVFSFCLAAVIALIIPCLAHADGLIIPLPPIGKPVPPPLSIKYHHVEVQIDDQIARTRVDQVFRNNFGGELEGTYIFPIPPGGVINDFSMYVGGEKVEARLLDREAALKIYEDIVRKQRDPALLEYAGRDIFKARVYPIPAFGEKRIGLAYAELVRKDGDLCSYRYSLDTEKFSRDPLEDVKVEVTITSKTTILSVYSPTHQIEVERVSPNKVVVSHREEDSKPDRDFILYYRLSKEAVDVSVLTYKEKGEEGYFLALISPSVWGVDEKILPKDVVFVFDRSGSMAGEKIEQAVSSLQFCLNSLNEGDRFALVTFNDQVEEMSHSLLPASRRNVQDAKDFVRRISASGGTDIDAALSSALAMLESGSRPRMVLFLTDGLPTVGITDIPEIVSRALDSGSKGTRIFTFGVGYDVNTTLLDRLANESKGSAEYVRPGEDIESKVSSLYSKIMNPVLTDISIDFGSVDAGDVYPRVIPDLFKGSQLIVVGRYADSGRTKVVLEGKMEGKTRRFEYSVTFGNGAQGNEFIPLLWASRKIGYLVDEIRAHGRNEELVEEIVRLSKKFGIMTEYTSFLVDKDVTIAGVKLYEEARTAMAPAEKAAGGWAVNQSINAKRMKDATSTAFNTYYDASGTEQEFRNVTQVGSKAFFQQSGNWVETTLKSKSNAITVKRFSKAYFQLLQVDPSAGAYLALGQNVLFNMGKQAVQIDESGKEVFTEAELAKLFK
jgi:Ca-activated chloride channel family protein